jgi:Domain of unknown function (DUF5060)
MKRKACTFAWLFCLVAIAAPASRAANAVRVWEKQELTFGASGSYANPYTDVIVWVDLAGPHFHKRVYGFWDGGKTFRVRLVATEPGIWKWRSGSIPSDRGLDGKSGSFTAVPWTEKEEQENPLRRASCAPRRTIMLWNWPMARLSSSSETPGIRSAPIAFVGMTTTRSAPWDRTPDSRTTCGIARRRATTG